MQGMEGFAGYGPVGAGVVPNVLAAAAILHGMLSRPEETDEEYIRDHD